MKTAGGDKGASIATGAHKQAAKVAHFRQLCTLGLGGQIIMPALLRSLAEILPYNAGVFYWADDRGMVSNRCEECPGEPANPSPPPADMAHAECLPGWPARLPACQRGVHCLRLFVGHNAWPAGMLVLTRDAAKRPFTIRDEHQLLRLAEYLSKGILTQRNQRAPYVRSGESGLLVFDQGGAVHQACAAGRRLLLQAACPQLAPARDAASSAAIEILGARLSRDFADAAQPAARLQNDWGLFEFRPHRLTLGNGRPGGLGVSVVRHEPLALRLMRGMKNLDLSSRQKEAVLLLAYGYSHRGMAERMGVSYHTAIDHVRKLHGKLGVRETPHLLAKVMGER
jgi:DNA-binding CsgD family transcriptional regulator